ncbi:hypothetical protein LMH87_012238 [Akanthomyces muscarius]|uniref:TIL domain-containing protein n=1 Tax=Akanthomyces muscarius TaxID=2231603 RepID=A0A9W8QCB1_AKAMU|nr:hypothetical protein LMH87_012238 [Akanthomyces muscarius]KAJ4151546.1 hypothetical protein LMH87_012238 [Akanthomyces muscarius]
MQLQRFILTAMSFPTVLAGLPTCPSNERWTRGLRCSESCRNASCPPPCVPNYTHGCFCIQGYLRNEDTKECVKQESCPVYTCPGHGNN